MRRKTLEEFGLPVELVERITLQGDAHAVEERLNAVVLLFHHRMGTPVHSVPLEP